MRVRSDPIYRKLDRIPAAPNFVRYNYDDYNLTLKAYVSFAKGMPTISYRDGLVLIKDLVLGIINTDQARKAARILPASPSREAVIEFVDAFCVYSDRRGYLATPAYQDFSTSFSIGRDIYVPVRPTLVARENGQLKPIFVFGWKKVKLDNFQRRLLMTMLEDAIFTLTDFASCDAEIVFLPETDGKREAEVWHRGDYNLLSPAELRNQVEIFLSAREAAYPIIDAWVLSRKPASAAPEIAEPIRPDLFTSMPPRDH